MFDSIRLIADQLVTAFEGGSNYWASWATVKDKKGKALTDCDFFDVPDRIAEVTVKPDDERVAVVLTRNCLRHGIKIMRRDYHKHYLNMITESGDATTADVYLQCCVFGKLIYG